MEKCVCGKEAKTLAGLKSHQRRCDTFKSSIPMEPVAEETELRPVIETEDGPHYVEADDCEADVMDGERKVRTYWAAVHGEGFLEMAKRFARKLNLKK